MNLNYGLNSMTSQLYPSCIEITIAMRYKIPTILITAAVLFNSCSILEKASMHGLNSGFYNMHSGQNTRKIYVDATEEKIDLYYLNEETTDKDKFLSIPFKLSDSILTAPLLLKKRSLDIDITTVLLKYRPSVYGLPQQLTTEFNAALYAGLRHDNYKIISRIDPLGRSYNKVTKLGYDFGLFAGPGATLISPFTTNNHSTDEYSGMIIQTGFAGFLESNIASFGIAAGFDYLLNHDRHIWIYHNKPWIGFIVGIAFN